MESSHVSRDTKHEYEKDRKEGGLTTNCSLLGFLWLNEGSLYPSGRKECKRRETAKKSVLFCSVLFHSVLFRSIPFEEAPQARERQRKYISQYAHLTLLDSFFVGC